MPNFNKSRGYKMKGFSYPGESPLKEPVESISAADVTDEQKIEMADEGSVQPKVDGNTESGGNKDKSKFKMGEGTGGMIAEQLLKTGLELGASAIANRKKKEGNKGASQSAFSGIQFGK
jgi:hypothetical protein